MSNESLANIIGLLPLILALVAGLIALVQVKSNVISNARLKWIEEMRKHLTEFCINVMDYAEVLERMKYKKSENGFDQKWIEKNFDLFMEYKLAKKNADKSGTAIALILNSEKKMHNELHDIINIISMELHAAPFQEETQTKLSGLILTTTSLGSEIIRKEWKKAKGVFSI